MKWITTCSLTLLFFNIYAQGWDKTFPEVMKITRATPTKDGGCLVMGHTSVENGVILYKLEGNGKRKWIKNLTNVPSLEEASETGLANVLEVGNENYFISINSNTSGIQHNLIKLDKDGNLIWNRTVPFNNIRIDTFLNTLVLLEPKKNAPGITELLRLNINGDTLSRSEFSLGKRLFFPTWSFVAKGSGIVLFFLNDITFRGATYNMGYNGSSDNVWGNDIGLDNLMSYPISRILKASFNTYIPILSGVKSKNFIITDSLGQMLFTREGNIAHLAATNPTDGSLIVLDDSNLTSNKIIAFVYYSVTGKLISERRIAVNDIESIHSFFATKNGYTIVAKRQNGTIRVIKTDTGLNLNPYFISGKVALDRDNNCSVTSPDLPISRVVVIAKKTGQADILATTDAQGKFSLNVEAGAYTVSMLNPNPYMESCTPSVIKTVSETTPVETADFVIKTSTACALMQVDVSTPRLRRCFNNNYTVSYCNLGSNIASDAYVNITLDSLLEFGSSSKNFASKTGRTYRFNIGNVGINECGSFEITTRVRCGDSTRLGQSICVDAKIYPDTCIILGGNNESLWSGASLNVTGTCKGDSVQFLVQNIGKTSTIAATSVIAENDKLQSLAIPSLAANSLFSKSFPANGSTWRLSVPQVPYHPLSNQPTAFIEGCRKNNTLPFITGFASNFSNDDAHTSVDIECQTIIGAYDPNDKAGFPIGLGNEKGIPQNQDIEYTIRFQNTGTDTAFTVVVRDTIDANLDITSIEWGSSSHQYIPEIYGKNIVKFTFDNILLVDSFKNEPKSNGFVKFRIKQKKDLLFGTKIQNSAGIYFDFNDPVITNKTLHTVSKPTILSGIFDKLNLDKNLVKVYPNPLNEYTVFEFNNPPLSNYILELYDMTGKVVRTEKIQTQWHFLSRNNLKSGIYLYKIVSDKKVFGAGKLIIF